MPRSAESTAILLCRGTVAFVWFYHGLFPKLLGPDEDEVTMNLALDVSRETAVLISYAAGIAELFLGAAMLVFWRQKWPLVLTCILMVALLGYAAFAVPYLLTAAFNPVTINVTVFVLALVALQLQSRLHS